MNGLLHGFRADKDTKGHAHALFNCNITLRKYFIFRRVKFIF